MARLRLFFGISFSEDALSFLDSLRIRLELLLGENFSERSRPKVRLLNREQLHATLVFLGGADESMLPDILAVLKQTASQLSTTEISLAGFGCFPERGAARVAFAGIQDASGVLARSAALLDTGCRPLGFLGEAREFHAHVTLARISEDPSQGAFRHLLQKQSTPTFREKVAGISLFHSENGPLGSRYRIIHRELLGIA